MEIIRICAVKLANEVNMKMSIPFNQALLREGEIPVKVTPGDPWSVQQMAKLPSLVLYHGVLGVAKMMFLVFMLICVNMYAGLSVSLKR